MIRPDAFAESLAGISLDDLVASGTRGIILDLDNTLVAYGNDELDPADVAWIRVALERDVRVVLLSNNFPPRVARIAQALGVPAIPNALKPSPTAFWQALRALGTPRRATIVVGDQLFTDVLGAKIVGLRAILTTPIVERDHGTTKVLRFFERLVIGRRVR